MLSLDLLGRVDLLCAEALTRARAPWTLPRRGRPMGATLLAVQNVILEDLSRPAAMDVTTHKPI
jgi:hypothetical protein